MPNVLDNPAKRFAVDFIERNAKPLATLSDSLFYFGELGMQEHRSAELLASLLEEHGFKVECGISGFPTGFLATYGSGATSAAPRNASASPARSTIAPARVDASCAR